MWKDVEGYEGIYRVNERGDVLSLERLVERSDGVKMVRKSRLLSKHMSTDGYPLVKVSKDGESKNIAVHILVATAFCERKPGCTEVNHIDCDRTNCNASNLEWVTHQQNVAHSRMLGRYAKREFRGAGNPNAKPVMIVELNKRFSTSQDCAAFLIDLGLTSGKRDNAVSCIRKAINKSKRYLGFTFADAA